MKQVFLMSPRAGKTHLKHIENMILINNNKIIILLYANEIRWNY